MYRDELPPAALVPVPRALEGFTTVRWPVPVDDGPPAVPLARRLSTVVEHELAFRVRVVSHEAELAGVQALRQLAYGRHLPEQAQAFGAADPSDRRPATAIFYAEDKLTGAIVGSARVQSNRHAPLPIEGSIELPEHHRGRMLAEITRLCVMPGYDHQVRLALVKASHLYCIALQIGGVVAGSRRSLVRLYESLGFDDLYGDERMCPLQHAGGLPHRVLFRDTVTSEGMARERRHADYDFVFRDFHPDIQIFDSLMAVVAGGLQAWPKAA